MPIELCSNDLYQVALGSLVSAIVDKFDDSQLLSCGDPSSHLLARNQTHDRYSASCWFLTPFLLLDLTMDVHNNHAFLQFPKMVKEGLKGLCIYVLAEAMDEDISLQGILVRDGVHLL
jgi:hypothetical protein